MWGLGLVGDLAPHPEDISHAFLLGFSERSLIQAPCGVLVRDAREQLPTEDGSGDEQVGRIDDVSFCSKRRTIKWRDVHNMCMKLGRRLGR